MESDSGLNLASANQKQKQWINLLGVCYGLHTMEQHAVAANKLGS